ncbi:winged helix-turn-helix domain-containing protein [Actinoplanes sp. LDG1-06]|uniref:Winged helix-turn-helix domain-containing protein n=1 Tax=Paractinoplanes ovalisporus TaxID=2810368 RepID=A0ABS2AGT9_9ACTN|nr:BTAD domain-containing putative transcriptional regulator [Actinoplanes ovalisporus]MBM2619044.1 winged helix-turn-helix domain-containing protein [Actinoplanes ovalisporus]
MNGVVRYSVLGPVRAWRGTEELELGSPQQRAVLAVLLLHEGRPAGADTLIASVWGDDPPRTAVLTLRTYVFRLRKILGDETIRTVTGGYALALAPDALDAAVYTRAVADALSGGDAAALARAESLWQGEPLADVAGGWAEAQRVRLQSERQAAVRERIALGLAAGHHGAAVAELTALVAAHPLDEGLRGLLMTALSGSGRQALAVTQYHEIRARLADELGLDPGPELQRTYQGLLNPPSSPPATAPASSLAHAVRPPHGAPLAPDSSVARPLHGAPFATTDAVPVVQAAPTAMPPARLVVPAQLPAAIRDFVGRDHLLDRLAAVLTRDAAHPTAHSAAGHAARPTAHPGAGQAGVSHLAAGDADGLGAVAAPVVGIVGIAGAGTSALAIRLAHRIRHAFPEGQLYADLRDTEVGQVLSGFLRAFGIAGPDIPAAVPERSALWRSVANGRRILVVLDHAPPSDELAMLLPVTPGAAAIMTGSRRVPSVAVDEWATAPLFTPEESVELLSRSVGAARIGAEPEAARRLAEMCSHIPLAIRMGAERLNARPNWTLTETADHLRSELDHPVVAHDDCRRAYRPHERRLDEVRAAEPLAAEAFVLGALTGRPEVVVADVAPRLGLPDLEAGRLLEHLVDMHLLEPCGFQRYRYLDVLRRLALRSAALVA